MHGFAHNTNNHARGRMGALVVVLALVSGLAGLARAQAPAIPATFVRNLSIPGLSDTIVRPTAIHYDRFHEELYVADFGHNRIVIFTPNGAYKYDFPLTEGLTAPADLTTDPAGHVYVLGTTPGGRVLQCFDYDGVILHRVPVPTEIAGTRVGLRSVACGDDGVLYALDHDGRRVLVLDRLEGMRRWFTVDLDSTGSEGMMGLGTLAINGDELLLPVPTAGTVLRMGTDGTHLGSLGTFGTKTGTLNFPVAAEVAPDGRVLVLDKNRFCVVVFDGRRITGEFGGKGINPGWFINPSLLAVPTADQVVVGQIFENKLQVCTLPTFERGRTEAGAGDDGSGGVAQAAAPEDNIARLIRLYRHTSDPFTSSPGGATTPQTNHTDSHLEVSE
jgi:hypothetical protein